MQISKREFLKKLGLVGIGLAAGAAHVGEKWGLSGVGYGQKPAQLLPHVPHAEFVKGGELVFEIGQ